MMLYRVNLDGVQQAIKVIRRLQYMLEDQLLPEFANALSQNLIEGDPKATQELQQAMDESSTLIQQLGNEWKKLTESLNAILNTLKQ